MSTDQTSLKTAALAYAASGRKIFPITPGAKTPLPGSNGFKDATSDLGQVAAWWDATPDANIGFEPETEGLALIDVDRAKATFDEIDFLGLELPETYVVTTPSGGEHWYFKGSVPASVGKLAPAVDTRGRGSYVLLPPSIVDGKQYHVKSNHPIVALPPAIEARLAPRHNTVQSQVQTLDLRGNITTARTRLSDLVKRGTVAVAGAGGNNCTYQVACELVRDLGLSAPRTLELMQEIWNPHCQPPWDHDELEAIVDHAANYGQNGEGAYASRPAKEVFGDIVESNRSDTSTPSASSKFQFLSGVEMHTVPEPKWIVKDLIPENSIVLITASKGSFKTFLAMDLAQGIATGKPTFGQEPDQTGPTFYGAHEGIYLIQRVHREAWCEAHGLDPATDLGFYVAPGPHVVNPDDIQDFGAAIQAVLDKRADGKLPKLIVLDTYSQCMMGLNENDPSDVSRFIFAAKSLITAFPGCSVLVLAHLGKDTSRGTRGSGAFEAAVDTVIDLQRTDDSRLVKAKVRFQRGAEERKASWYFQGRQVGKSLVFDPMLSMEYKDVQAASDMFERRNMAFLLRKLKAVSEETAVMTPVLAASMTKREQGETEELHKERLNAVERALRRLARTTLSMLVVPKSTPLKWYVPTIDETE